MQGNTHYHCPERNLNLITFVLYVLYSRYRYANRPSRSLKIRVFVDSGKEQFPPKNFDYRLLRTLQNMKMLENLELDIPEYHTDAFADVFDEANLSLPSVKKLVLGSYNDFMVKHCPNVETISSNGWVFLHSKRGVAFPADSNHPEHASMLVGKAAEASKLTYFEMSQLWTAAQLEGQSYSRDLLFFQRT
jgi:hypothetical protein